MLLRALSGTQWWPHVKYITDHPIYGYDAAIVALDKRVFDQIVAFANKWGQLIGIHDVRGMVRRVIKGIDEDVTKMRPAIRKADAEAREELISRGAIEEVHFPEEEIEKLRHKILPLYDKLVDKKIYPRWFLDEILKYRQEYRKLKAEGKKLDEFHETGILPGGNQFDEWRTKWGE